MRASWGYDQSTFPKKPSLANPGGRVSDVEMETEARDPTIPDGSVMPTETLVGHFRAMKKYAAEKELNMTHTFQGTGGKPNGVISKPKFKTALGQLFHQFMMTE